MYCFINQVCDIKKTQVTFICFIIQIVFSILWKFKTVEWLHNTLFGYPWGEKHGEPATGLALTSPVCLHEFLTYVQY